MKKFLGFIIVYGIFTLMFIKILIKLGVVEY